MPFEGNFDARQIAPKQGGGKHQVGNKWPAAITGTEAKKVKDKDAGLFAVTFTSPGGSIIHNYNLWSDSEVARRIANEQLSALCHATGIFQLNFRTDGAELRGSKCLIDVGFQAGQEPSADKPEGGYVELKKVYDMAGNEPGVAPQQSQQSPQQSYQGGQQQQQQPQAGNAGWSGQQQQQPVNNQPQGQVNAPSNNALQGGWNGQQPQGQQQAPQNNAGGWSGQQQTDQQQPNSGGWSQQGNVPQTAPWNK